MNISAGWLGVIRGVGMVAIMAILPWLGNATHLSMVLNPSTSSLIAVLALGVEHAIEGGGGGALFGTVNKNRG